MTGPEPDCSLRKADRMPQTAASPHTSFTVVLLTSYSASMCRIAMVFTIILSGQRLFPRQALSIRGAGPGRRPSAPGDHRQARRHRRLHARHDDAVQGARRPIATGRKPGDLINATLVVTNSTGRLEDIVNIGEAPLPADAAHGAAGRAARTRGIGRRRGLLDQVGPRAAAVRLARQDAGRHVRIHALSAPRLLPAHGPQFRRSSASLVVGPALAGRIHLLSVSFDPALRHAEGAGGAREKGGRPTRCVDVADRGTGFGRRVRRAFGVSIMRDDQPDAGDRPQPADRRHRPLGAGREDLQRQRLEAGRTARDAARRRCDARSALAIQPARAAADRPAAHAAAGSALPERDCRTTPSRRPDAPRCEASAASSATTPPTASKRRWPQR